VPFDAILGQATAIGTLTRALRSGHVHHALRFEGPDGVGKELTAMAVAQALVCSGGDPLGCGTCSACRRASTFSDGTPKVVHHPDIIFVERGFYPPETIGRSRPETQDISVDQVRSVVLTHAAYPPHEGRARVFIVRRADELSNSAANALLKTLEEPGAGTHFILLTSRPSRLISTIRSRSFRIRFNPLPRPVLLDLLKTRGVGDDRANEVVDLAAGSASLALKLADPDASSGRNAFVQAAIDALHSKDAAGLLALAESRSKDKQVLRENLEALAARLARMAHAETFANEARAPLDAIRYQIVLQAMRELDRNASPALLIESMMLRMRAASE